jgi:hypothetical protein
MTDIDPCSHLDRGRLEVVLPLDDYLGIAEAVVRCSTCCQSYLIELLDISGIKRAFRLTAIEQTIADQLVRDLTRGSCDAQRAATEVQAIKTRYVAPTLWLVTQHGAFSDIQLNQSHTPLPTCSWRELPLDGRWLANTTTRS